MKIGILTFHRAHNYGAVLQCYALQEVLKSMGHNVSVIDYRQPYIEEIYKVIRPIYWLKNLIRLRKIALLYPIKTVQRLKRKKNFDNFQNKYLNCTTNSYKEIINLDFDLYIVGSDQLWNTKLTGGFDNVYWGNFKKKTNSKIVAYAMSTSLNNLKSIPINELLNSFKNFQFISTREYQIANYIKTIDSNIPVQIVLDPTLITNSNIWESILDHSLKDKKYILIYKARGDISLLKEKAKILSNKIHCEIIDLSCGTYTVQEFVSYFKYATYVITTSFHAVAFSLIFERPFYAICLNDGHDDRYVSLLRAIGAENRLVTPDFIPRYDIYSYDEISYKLGVLKKESINYLKKCINPISL